MSHSFFLMAKITIFDRTSRSGATDRDHEDKKFFSKIFHHFFNININKSVMIIDFPRSIWLSNLFNKRSLQPITVPENKKLFLLLIV